MRIRVPKRMVLFAFVAVALMFGAMFAVNVGALIPGASASSASPSRSDTPVATSSGLRPLNSVDNMSCAFDGNFFGCSGAVLGVDWQNGISAIGAQTCNNVVLSDLYLGIFGPGCTQTAYQSGYAAGIAASEVIAQNNTAILLGDATNITAGAVANLNATMSELLSYFENRAEALVPYFIGQLWNQTTYDQIAIASGLVPAIEGMVTAIATQEYQDWNATRNTWEANFGPGSAYQNPAHFQDWPAMNFTGYAGPSRVNQVFPFSGNGLTWNVSQPWELWSAATPLGYSTTEYFNLAPGGTIVCGDINVSTVYTCPTFKVTDLTQGFNFTVPTLDLSQWQNQTAASIPIVTTIYHISEFDLLKLTCTAHCNNSLKDVEVSNGFVFENPTTSNPDLLNPNGLTPIANTMIPMIALLNGYTQNTWTPTNEYTFCVTHYSTALHGPQCASASEGLMGDALALGTGPSSVAGGNNTFTRFASTFQHLVNNTMNTAEVDFLTLQAITNAGQNPVPADCVIPPPSDAFPASVNPAQFNLDVADGLVVYWGYLNAIGKAFANSTIQGLEFCGDPHLGLSFNWTGSWYLTNNITASVYLGGLNGTGVYPDGTPDPLETYSNPATWAVRNVNPTLLYPYEYQANVPLNTTYAIPLNDPMAVMLINYAGNPLYNSSTLNYTPKWGVPTYLTLNGVGNYIYDNGTLSGISSGRSLDTADAIRITSCVVGNVSENPCKLQVTYFDHFTYGHVTGLHGLTCEQAQNCNSSGRSYGTDILGIQCFGTAGLNQWYDAWGAAVVNGVGSVFSVFAGIPFIGGALVDLGCFIGWVILIIIGIVLIYIIYRVVLGVYHVYEGKNR